MTGVGLLARYIHAFLKATGWSFDEILVFDLWGESEAGVGIGLLGVGCDQLVRA